MTAGALRTVMVTVGVVAAGLIGWLWLYVSLIASSPCSREQPGDPSNCGAVTPALGVLFAVVGFVGIAALAVVAWQAIASLRVHSGRISMRALCLMVALCVLLQVLLVFAIRAGRPDPAPGVAS